MPGLVYIGLGGNVGDTRQILRTAVESLIQGGVFELRDNSSLYETTPTGGPPGQRDYLNAVLEVATALSAQGLLEALHQAERDHGRQRQKRWQPRTLDLDVLFFGERIISEEDLVIPHPRLHQRRFVLQPLAEIAPDLQHPVLHRSVSELLASLAPTGEQVRRQEAAQWLCADGLARSDASPQSPDTATIPQR